MSFFPGFDAEEFKKKQAESKPAEDEPQPEKEKVKMDPTQVIIDGDKSSLVKVIEDNENLPEGKVDIRTPFGWQALNYNPQTGEMK